MTADHAERVQAFLDEHEAAVREDFLDWTPTTGAELLASDVRAVLDELKQLRAATIPSPALRQAWRNGWMDRGHALCQTITDAGGLRDGYERAFARYMSDDPAEDDKDPYRPLDGPGDPAAAQQPAAVNA